jgi:ribonuclease HI
MPEKLLIYTDGGSRNNPGDAAIGVLVTDQEGDIIYKHGEYIGKKTNNQAEYIALIKALEKAKNYFGNKLSCFSDSQLMIRQLNGEYKVKNIKIKKLFLKVKNLEKKFQEVRYFHVNRETEQIRIVDRLVNQVLDKLKK